MLAILLAPGLRIHDAEQLLARLGPQQCDDHAAGPDGPDRSVAGSGVGVEALDAASTRLGEDSRWGAEGPGPVEHSEIDRREFHSARRL